jgi:hypothetical protein
MRKSTVMRAQEIQAGGHNGTDTAMLRVVRQGRARSLESQRNLPNLDRNTTRRANVQA